MIKLGCCLPGGSFMPQGVAEIDKSTYGVLKNGCNAVKSIGYDYCEAAVGMIMNLTDEEFHRAVESGEIRIYAANSLIPGKFHIARPEEGLSEFVEKSAYRLSALGAKIVVMGSGAARRYSDDTGYEKGREYLVNFLRMCDGCMKKYGLVMALEPLNSKETNMMVTVDEGADIARGLIAEGCGNIKLLGDTYHMSHEPVCGGCTVLPEDGFTRRAIKSCTDNIDILVHTHAAEPFDRRYPGSHDGSYVGEFISALREAGYEGGMTVECGFGDFAADARAAFEFLDRERNRA